MCLRPRPPPSRIRNRAHILHKEMSSSVPPAKRLRTNASEPHERAFDVLRREMDAGASLEDAIRTLTADDAVLRDAILSCVNSTPALREDLSALAALFADAPAISSPNPFPTLTTAQTTAAATESAPMLSALRAAVNRGLNLDDAVLAALSGRTRVAAPVLAAINAAPRLREDLTALAELCEAVEDAAAISGRTRLNLQLSAFTDVAKIVSRARNIVVLAGAGVSVSCGIPDFRSSGGLYDSVRSRFGMPDPQAVFDLAEFRLDPALFYAFAREIMPQKAVIPSSTHRFIAELARRGRLRRVYTQNIDGLERRAGVPLDALVPCHGSFLTATCMRPSCRRTYENAVFADTVAMGDVPVCPACNSSPPREQLSADSDEDNKYGHDEAAARAVLKPDIVFFGEPLPRRVNDCLEEDLHRADLLLVLGTSLQVAPVARIPAFFPPHLPRVLVNRELVDYRFDVELLGNCDAVVDHLRAHLGWDCKPGDRKPPVPPAATFVPPRRFIFEGTAVTEEDPVDDNDEASLLAMLSGLCDMPSDDSESDNDAVGSAAASVPSPPESNAPTDPAVSSESAVDIPKAEDVCKAESDGE